MKSRPVFLLCGALLLTAFSVRADSVFYSGAANESPNTELSATEAHGVAAKFQAPAMVGVTPESFSTVAPAWGRGFSFLALEADSPITANSAKKFQTSVLMADTPENGERPSDPSPAIASIGGFEPGGIFFPASGDLVSSSSNSEDAHLKIGHEHHKGGNGKGQDPTSPASIVVPEPGAFSLLLFGLVAVGIPARRRSVLTTTA